MYIKKLEIDIIDIYEEIKIVGLNLLNSGMAMSNESINKMWDKENFFTKDKRDKIRHIKKPIIEYGISLNKTGDFIVGKEVEYIGIQEKGFKDFTIPIGRYIEVVFNGMDKEKLMKKDLKDNYIKTPIWAKDRNIFINNDFVIEVYPRDKMDLKYPEMKLLFPLK